MSNYTRPHDPDYEDKPEDWLVSSMIFARALGHILHDYEGIVVELKGEMKKMFPEETNKVVVFNKGNQIIIDPCSDKLNEGDFVIVKDIDENLN